MSKNTLILLEAERTAFSSSPLGREAQGYHHLSKYLLDPKSHDFS